MIWRINLWITLIWTSSQTAPPVMKKVKDVLVLQWPRKCRYYWWDLFLAPLGAQGAEVIALTEVAKYGLKYAFGICHATGTLWKEQGFLTSAGKSMPHRKQIKELLEAIQLPSEISVIYRKAHTQRQVTISKGNSLSDQAARAAAPQVVSLYQFHNMRRYPSSQL